MKIFLWTLVSILLLSIAVTSAAKPTGYVADYLSQAQFTTKINKRVPVDNIRKLSTRVKKVYFFTDVRDCEDCDIEHQWWYRGKKVSSVEGEATSNRYRWWTSKTLNANYLGDWTVKVIIDDDEVYTKTFTYYKPTRKQKQTTPIQRRVIIQEADDCELQLRYFSDKVVNNPDDPYFKFMLNKWGKRCSGE